MTTKPIADALHDELHRIPGMPAHETAAANNRHEHSHAKPARKANPTDSNRNANLGEPRVLVSLQERIARAVTRDED